MTSLPTTIIVYGKDGCKKCDAAKDKIRLLGFEYQYRDLSTSVQLHPGWREDGTVELMTAHAILDTMPLISINRIILDYPLAMRTLKAMQAVEENRGR